jgi:hypothetical protein
MRLYLEYLEYLLNWNYCLFYIFNIKLLCINMITKYTIYGERCSGTNYLEQLMLHNFDIEITWEYGWKHFFGFNDLSNTEHVLFIGIIRNLCDWCNSLYRKKHHLTPELTKDVDSFLNNTFYSVDKDNNEYMTDRHIETKKRYKNIFELRQVKNKFLLETMPTLVKNYCIITYDSLIDNFTNIMNKIRSFGLIVKPNINFPINVYYYKKNTDIVYFKKKNKIEDEIILNKADLFYEKILFPKFNTRVIIKLKEKNINKIQKVNDKYYQKILNMNKDRNINVEFIIPDKLLNKEVLSFYNSWKNGHSLNYLNKKLPKNVKNIILKKKMV